MVFERKALSPIRAHPFGSQGWVDGEGAFEVAVEFPMQGTKTLSRLRRRVLGMFQADQLNGPLRAASTLSRAVGVGDHPGSNEIAVADSHLQKHGPLCARAEKSVSRVTPPPRLREVSGFD